MHDAPPVGQVSMPFAPQVQSRVPIIPFAKHICVQPAVQAAPATQRGGGVPPSAPATMHEPPPPGQFSRPFMPQVQARVPAMPPTMQACVQPAVHIAFATQPAGPPSAGGGPASATMHEPPPFGQVSRPFAPQVQSRVPIIPFAKQACVQPVVHMALATHTAGPPSAGGGAASIGGGPPSVPMTMHEPPPIGQVSRPVAPQVQARVPVMPLTVHACMQPVVQAALVTQPVGPPSAGGGPASTTCLPPVPVARPPVPGGGVVMPPVPAMTAPPVPCPPIPAAAPPVPLSIELVSPQLDATTPASNAVHETAEIQEIRLIFCASRQGWLAGTGIQRRAAARDSVLTVSKPGG